jgi:hypothetical protein
VYEVGWRWVQSVGIRSGTADGCVNRRGCGPSAVLDTSCWKEVCNKRSVRYYVGTEHDSSLRANGYVISGVA